MENKTNLFVHFLGESPARQNCFRFYLTFSIAQLYTLKVPMCISRTITKLDALGMESYPFLLDK